MKMKGSEQSDSLRNYCKNGSNKKDYRRDLKQDTEQRYHSKDAGQRIIHDWELRKIGMQYRF